MLYPTDCPPSQRNGMRKLVPGNAQVDAATGQTRAGNDFRKPENGVRHFSLLLDHRERSEELFEVLVTDDDARGFLFDKMRDAFMRRVIATDSTAGNPSGGD